MRCPTLLALPIVFFTLAGTSEAQIYNCEGRWTNKPCSSSAAPVLEEKESSAAPAEVQERRSKDGVLHEATMKSIEARREYSLHFEDELEELRTLCEAADTSLDKCRERADELISRMEEKIRIAAAESDRKQTRRQEDERRVDERNNVAVVVGNRRGAACAGDAKCIIDDDDDNGGLIIGDDPDIIIIDPSPRGSSKPVFEPGPFHRARPNRATAPSRRNP